MAKRPTRLEDAETVLYACVQALALVPITQIRKGSQWFPSEEALDMLAFAKDSIEAYARKHQLNGDFHVR